MPPRKAAAAKKTAATKEETATEPAEPTRLLFTQDGRVIAPEEIGGPVIAPASDEPGGLVIVDRSLIPQPPAEQPDPSAFEHKTWAVDAVGPEEQSTEGAGEKVEGDEE